MDNISLLAQKVKSGTRRCASSPKWNRSSPLEMEPITTKKALVLDLDETLIHSSFIPAASYDFQVDVIINGQKCPIFVKKRPYLDHFLSIVEDLFDIYIFTASDPQYSIPVVQALFPKFPIQKILTRQHCRFFNGTYLKDLRIFSRPLSDIILVDNLPSSYALQPQNGISITSWTGDINDCELIKPMLSLLQHCAFTDDVRTAIRTFIS